MDLKPVKKWECQKCPKTLKTKRNFNRHVITHDPDAKVQCKICGHISKNPPALSAHMSSRHTNRKRPKCDTCQRVFYSAANLQQHIAATHSTSERPRFPCTFPGCEKTYQTKGNVSKHVKTEHAENQVRFPCTLCIKEFRTGQDLENHISTHLREEPFNCSTCGTSFVHKAHFKNHERTHLDISTRSKCHICPQTFVSKPGLQRHIRVVHENKRNYPCEFCDTRFSKPSYLKRHVEAKHATNNELIHSCDKCEYTTHSEACLALHGKWHEPANDSQES